MTSDNGRSKASLHPSKSFINYVRIYKITCLGKQKLKKPTHSDKTSHDVNGLVLLFKGHGGQMAIAPNVITGLPNLDLDPA